MPARTAWYCPSPVNNPWHDHFSHLHIKSNEAGKSNSLHLGDLALTLMSVTILTYKAVESIMCNCGMGWKVIRLLLAAPEAASRPTRPRRQLLGPQGARGRRAHWRSHRPRSSHARRSAGRTPPRPAGPRASPAAPPEVHSPGSQAPPSSAHIKT